MKNKTSKILYWVITLLAGIAIASVGYAFTGIAKVDTNFPINISLVLAVVFTFIVSMITFLSSFVYMDAKKRNINPWKWMSIVAYTPSLFGLLIYVIKRKELTRIAQ